LALVPQAEGANDHPTFTNFVHLYRMLSTYNLLNPPQFAVQYVLDSDTKKSQIKKSMRENSGKIDLLIGKTDTNKENEEFDNDMIFHSLDQDTIVQGYSNLNDCSRSRPCPCYYIFAAFM
jgi:hypothetical protein